jgi:hypothetical protein
METEETPTAEIEPGYTDIPIGDDEAPIKKRRSLEELLAGLAVETVNVMEVCTDEQLTELGSKTHRQVERDWRSGEKWRKRHANILKLYFGDLPPLPNGEQLANAQIHYPIIATAVIRIAARIYDQQFPSNGEYFGCKPTDANDIERTLRVAKFMNWQIDHKIKNYVANYDVLIVQVLLYGSGFTMLSYDHENECPRHDVIATEDIILPYKRSLATDPNMGDMPRITRVLRKYRYELEDLATDGYYNQEAVGKIYEDEDERGSTSMLTDSMTSPVQQAIDKDAGVDSPENDPDAPRVLWEMHTRYKFKGEKRGRPVIITIDKHTKRVLCIKIREDEDPEDRARYNREADQVQASFAAAMQQYERDMMAYSSGMPVDIAGPPMGGDAGMTPLPMPGATDATMPMVDPMMPTPPEEPPGPVPPRMIPINYFYHHKCLSNPDGVYGNGIGTLLEGHNMFADTVGAQIVNTGTLSNTPTLLMAENTRMTRGEIRIRPGEVNTVSSFGKIADAFFQLQFPPPDATMGQLIKDQEDAAAELSGAGEILSGEVGGSNETATTTQIRISQALSNIAILNKRETRVRTAEAQGIARINSVHLKGEQYFAVVDPIKQVPGQPTVVDMTSVTRADFLMDTDITITADPRMSSQPQRLAEAMQAMGVVSQNPLLAQNIALVQAAAREVFLAIDRPQLVAAMMSMPPMMPGAPGMAGPPAPGGEQDSTGGSPRPEPVPPPIPGTNQPPNGAQMEGEIT